MANASAGRRVLPRPGSHLVLIPAPRPTSDVPYHHDRAPGQKYLVIDDSVVSGSPVYVALRRVDGVAPDQTPWLDPHEHTCNSFYLFAGEGTQLTGLRATVTLGDSTFPVESPAAAMIPPRVLHHYQLTQGTGWYVQITLAPDYPNSLVPEAELRTQAPRMFDEAEVHRPASLRSGRWTFISEDDPPGAGVRVDAESATAFLERGEPKTHDLRLDLFLPLSGSTGSLRLICHGGSEDLASPIALVHVGEPPRISHVHGDILALGLRVPGPGIRGARP